MLAIDDPWRMDFWFCRRLAAVADDEWRPGGKPAAVRMTMVKGVGDPAVRAKGTLREVAESPNLALTMVHAADEGADLVRELGVFVPWAERRQVVAETARRLATGAICLLEQAIRAVEAEFASITTPPLQLSEMAGESAAKLACCWPGRWTAGGRRCRQQPCGGGYSLPVRLRPGGLSR